MINLKLKGERVDLEGDEVIAASYSIYPIGNIAKRTAFKSVEFGLPLTANNQARIESNQIIVNNSTLPFEFIEASVDVDGIDQKLTSAQLVSIKDTIKLRLFGGNIDFYNLIKDLKLRDLDLSDLDHVWNLNLLAWRDLRFNTSGVIYPVIDFHADSPNAIVNDTDAEINARYMYPAIFRHTLITRIIEGVGFTLQGNFLSNVDYLSTLIQTHTTTLSDEYKNFLQSKALQFYYIYYDFGNPSVETYAPVVILINATQTLSFFALSFTDIINDSFNLLSEFSVPIIQSRIHAGVGVASGLNPINPPTQGLTRRGTRYTAKITGDYSFRITIKYALANVVPVIPFRIEIWNSNNVAIPVQFQEFLPSPTGTEFVYEFSEPMVKGEYLFFIAIVAGAQFLGANIYTLIPGGSFEVTESPENYSYGDDTTLAVNLPDMTQPDFLLDTVIKFGLMLQIDNDNKIVRFRQFSEIIANKPNAIDMSDKVDYSEKPEIKFDSDYAQVNEYKYADDDTVVKPPGTDYELVINNQLLPPRKTIFQSKFAATEQVLRFGGISINQIKLITLAGTTNQEEESVKYRELILSKHDFVLTVVDGSASTTWSTEIPTTRFIKDGEDFNLGFGNLIPRFSGDIVALVRDFRTSVQLLRLNAVDINQLDFFIPWWVKRNNEPGAYFYVSEINQFKFTSVESTEVEMVLLP